MKKIFFILVALLWEFTAIGQMVGSGTSLDPYRGTLNTNDTWTLSSGESGTVYIGNSSVADLQIISGGDLIISPGVTIIFTQLTSDLIITGTGRLRAQGDQSDLITFTRNSGNANWGHISFQSMDGSALQSVLDLCIIEWGSKTAVSGVDSYGGGLHSSFSNLIVSNNIFRNNTAKYGGAVFFDQAKPLFTTCRIINNTATLTGGGIYIYQVTDYSITNCIVENNTATGGGGGGGIWLHNVENTRIINSTIVNNRHTGTGNKGHNLAIYRSTTYTNPSNYTYGVNSIFWNNSSTYDVGSIWYNLHSIKATDFVNSAFSGSFYSTYTACIQLNNNNTAATGPNFINPVSGGDYQLTAISPCRDAGVNSFGAITIPTTDFLGNSTIGFKDIGAFEVQYSRWTGATSNLWATATNWEANMVPSTGSSDVIIPAGLSNYPTGSTTQDFTLGTGTLMIIEQDASLTLNNFTNNGTIRLNSSAAGIASLILNNYTRGAGGTEEIQLFLTGGGSTGTYRWHYISSPVSSLSTDIFTGTTTNLAQYDESLISDEQNNGWVAYDGWIYLPLPAGYGGSTFNNLNVGQGYNHYFSADHTYTFGGLFNTSNVTIPLAYHSSGTGTEIPIAQGFNLVGNPFSSCIDWDQIDNTLDATIGGAIYFNKSGTVASWVGGVGTNGGTGIIPPMQGFFVKANSTGKSVTLPANARLHDASQVRYKSAEIIPLVRLKLENESAESDDAVVRFNNLATAAVDNSFDAYKFSKTGGAVSIWTSTGGFDLSINGLPFPADSVEIPVSINCTTAGILEISGSQIEGLDDYNVTLTDKAEDISIDLKTASTLSIDAPAGIITDRFVLKISFIKGTQTIEFTALPVKTFGDADFSPIASASSGLPVSYASDNANVATIVSGMIHITGAGSAIITASQPGNTSYNPAISVPMTLTVSKASQTITFAELPGKLTTDADFSPGATASTGFAVSYLSNNSAVATIVDGMIHITGAGTAVITASQAGNTNYNAATDASRTLTVSLPTGLENISSENVFKIYSVNNLINIEIIADAWDGKSGSVKIFDLTGKPVTDLTGAEFNKGSMLQVFVQREGLYIVELRSGIMRFVGKVVVR